MHPTTPQVPMGMDADSVERLAQGWDQQHTDLRTASGLLADAPTTGFTPPVAHAAADFLRAWTAHTGTVAEVSGHQAEALRAVLGAWARTDDQVAHLGLLLLGLVDRPGEDRW